MNRPGFFIGWLVAMATMPLFVRAADSPARGKDVVGAAPALAKATSRDLGKAERVVGRTSWLFPHGYYREIDPKVWITQQNNQRRLRETARTGSYVELFDSEHKLYVRLFDHRALQRRAEEKEWRPFYPGHWQDPALVPLNTMKLPSLRGEVEQAAVRDFPHLGKRFEVLGPATPSYNCIAWSLGLTNRWLWPGSRVSDFDRLNGTFGYRRISGLDFTRRANTDRIVLYGKNRGGLVEATHQARQLADGSWSSKLGALPLVRHLRPTDLDGAVYGVPVAVYVRERSSDGNGRP